MTTITLPEDLASRLQQRAALQHRSVDDLAIDILSDALETQVQNPSVADVVAHINATPSSPERIRLAQGSLFEALQDISDTSSFDLQQWNDDWQQVEEELRTMNQIDDQPDQSS